MTNKGIGADFIKRPDGRIMGFGTDEFRVMVTDRRIARAVIKTMHYSGTVNIGSAIHLGIYVPDLVGILQFGTGQNPGRGDSVVAGTKKGEWLELDRMWVSDAMPRNTESQALSYALKLVRRLRPSVAWVQSFADERCGRFGVVYQAANFRYVGHHYSPFFEIDGQWFHSIHFSVKNGPRTQNPKTAFAKANAHRAIKHRFKQFRYIFFLKPSFMARLKKKVQPYPKAFQLSGEQRGSTVKGRVSSSGTLQSRRPK